MKKKATFILVLFGLIAPILVLGQNDEPVILEEVLLNGQTIDLRKGFRLHDEGLKEAQRFTLKLGESAPKLVDIHCTGAYERRALFTSDINLLVNTSAEISEDGKEISFDLSTLRNEITMERWEDNPKGARLVIELFEDDSEDSFYLFSVPVIVD